MSVQTLLLTLAGPQQSWGSRSRFATRGTESAPTRSGVLGLIAAAMGMERTDPLDRFASLRFGVRVDRPGRVERDFQTARTLDGKTSMPLSQRYYLADAVFLAGLESSDDTLLDEIHAALRQPRHPLYLGRRAFPPAGPIRMTLVAEPLLEALSTAPWQVASVNARHPGSLELYVDAEPGGTADLSLEDVPVSFDPRRRRYAWRDVQIRHVTPPGLQPSADSATVRTGTAKEFVPPPHDPMLLVSDQEV